MSGKPWEDYADHSADADGPWNDYKDAKAEESGLAKAAGIVADTALSGARAAGNIFTGGYSPQLAGIGSAIMPDPLKGQNEALRDQGFRIEEPEFGTYVQGRDAAADLLKEDDRKHPYVNPVMKLAGGITGGIVAAPLLGALTPGSGALLATKAAQGATLAGKTAALGTRALGSGYQAAALGALSNPGDHPGEVDPLQTEARAKQAMLMGAIGFPAHIVAEGVVSTLPAANAVKDYASEKYAKAIGLTKAQYKKLQLNKGEEGIKDLGRAAKEEGLIPFFSTPGKIAARAEAAKEQVGDELGQLLTDADAAAASLPPVGYRPSGPEKTLSPAVQVQPIEHTMKLGKPVTQKVTPDVTEVPVNERVTEPLPGGGTSVSFKMGEPKTIPGISADISTVQRGVKKSGPVQTIQEPVTMTPVEPVPAGRVSATELAGQIRRDPKLQLLMTTPGKERAAAQVREMLETLEKNGDKLTLQQAQDLKVAIDEGLNYNRAIPEMKGSQSGLFKIRTAIRDKMNEIVNSLAPQLGTKADDLLKVNRRYGQLEQIRDVAANRHAMNQSNRAVGLTDTIAGGAGASTGATIGGYVAGPMGAKIGAGVGGAVGIAGNKVARTFGPSMMGHSADFMANLYTIVGPKLAAEIQKNPAMLPMVMQALNPGSTLGPSQDIPMSDPWLEPFKMNPGLVDKLQNETLKAQIKKRLDRNVTGGK